MWDSMPAEDAAELSTLERRGGGVLAADGAELDGGAGPAPTAPDPQLSIDAAGFASSPFVCFTSGQGRMEFSAASYLAGVCSTAPCVADPCSCGCAPESWCVPVDFQTD